MKKKILLVDDEKDFLDIMSQKIRSWGYEVVSASNAEDAMRAFKRERPSAAILDYVMPEVNGVQLLMRIRAVDMKIPVIMFTVKPQSEVIEDAEKLDILAFIPKLSPYTDTQANLKTALSIAFQKEKGKNAR